MQRQVRILKRENSAMSNEMEQIYDKVLGAIRFHKCEFETNPSMSRMKNVLTFLF